MITFEPDDLLRVSEALEIAEDTTANFYKLSPAQWKRHRFDVKTLSTLREDEISHYAFALLNKSERSLGSFESKTKKHDFYFICLQDHLLLNALMRDGSVSLLPLLVYVFTHELVHIVRFCNFSQRFGVSDLERHREEGLVHGMTFEILRNLRIPNLDYVLDSYEGHRICDISSAESC